MRGRPRNQTVSSRQSARPGWRRLAHAPALRVRLREAGADLSLLKSPTRLHQGPAHEIRSRPRDQGPTALRHCAQEDQRQPTRPQGVRGDEEEDQRGEAGLEPDSRSAQAEQRCAPREDGRSGAPSLEGRGGRLRRSAFMGRTPQDEDRRLRGLRQQRRNEASFGNTMGQHLRRVSARPRRLPRALRPVPLALRPGTRRRAIVGRSACPDVLGSVPAGVA